MRSANAAFRLDVGRITEESEGVCKIRVEGTGATLFPIYTPSGWSEGELRRRASARGLGAIEEFRRAGGGGCILTAEHVECFSDFTNRRRLYYSRSVDGRIRLATRLTAFSNARVDLGRLRYVLAVGFIPPPLTPLSGVFKLPAATKIVLKRRGHARVMEREFFGLSVGGVYRGGRDLERRLREEVRRGINEKTVTFLSGGLDSSLLLGLSAEELDKTCAYTAVYSGYSSGEARAHAQNSARKYDVPLVEVPVDKEVFSEVVGSVVAVADEPFADVATVAETAVGRRVRRDGWERALEGEGADSSFCGSYKFLVERYARMLEWGGRLVPLLSVIGQHRRSAVGNLARRLGVAGQMLREERGVQRSMASFARLPITKEWQDDGWQCVKSHYKELYEELEEGDPLNRLAAVTFFGVIPYLENRKLECVERVADIRLVTPFLQPAVAALAFSLPGSKKVQWGYGKVPLRDSFSRMLPAHVKTRRKASFVPPVSTWLLDEYRNVLLKGRVWEKERTEACIEEHVLGRRDWGAVLWSLFCAESWLDRWSRRSGSWPGENTQLIDEPLW